MKRKKTNIDKATEKLYKEMDKMREKMPTLTNEQLTKCVIDLLTLIREHNILMNGIMDCVETNTDDIKALKKQTKE